MGITNPGQEYFKDGGWHWTGSEWIKGGLAFEYASQVVGRTVNLDAAAGNNFLQGTAVPAGYVWVITGLSMVNTSNAVTVARVGAYVSANYYWAAMAGALLRGVGLSWSGQMCLVATDRPECLFQGCTLGDDLYLYYFGYAMRLT